MNEYEQRFLFALTREDKRLMYTMAQMDGITAAGTLRRLLRQEARKRGLLLVDSDPDGGQAKEAGSE